MTGTVWFMQIVCAFHSVDEHFPKIECNDSNVHDSIKINLNMVLMSFIKINNVLEYDSYF